MNTYGFLEEALRPERLMALASEVTKGTGGPVIPLPDGASVSAAVVVKALEAARETAKVDCMALVQALSDRQAYIRYGALVMLQKLTGIKEPDYFPFQDPESPENLDAIEKWKARCAGF